MRGFILEVPDEFLDPDSEEETTLTSDKRKVPVSIHTYCTGPADTTHRNGTNAKRLQKRSRRSSPAVRRRGVFATIRWTQPQTLSMSKPRRKQRKKPLKVDSRVDQEKRDYDVTPSKFSELKESNCE